MTIILVPKKTRLRRFNLGKQGLPQHQGSQGVSPVQRLHQRHLLLLNAIEIDPLVVEVGFEEVLDDALGEVLWEQ